MPCFYRQAYAILLFVRKISNNEYCRRIPVYRYLVERIACRIIGIAFHRRGVFWYHFFRIRVGGSAVRTSRNHAGDTFVYPICKSRTQMRIIGAVFSGTRYIAYAESICAEKIIKLTACIFFGFLIAADKFDIAVP